MNNGKITGQTYKVKDVKKPGNDLAKWDSLKDLNVEIRKSVEELMKKFITVKVVIEKDLKNSTELIKTLKGVESTFKEILEKIDLLTSLHTKDENGKRIFYTGAVNLFNDKENSLYIDSLTSYVHLGEMIESFSNISITALMAEFKETLEKEGKNGK